MNRLPPNMDLSYLRCLMSGTANESIASDAPEIAAGETVSYPEKLGGAA